MKLSPLVLVALLATSCAPKFTFTPAGETVPEAKDDDCDIEVLTAPPARPYREIGTFENTGTAAAETAAEFRDAVREKACSVGADAVLVLSPSSYHRGSAIVWVTAEPAASAP